ncbi:thiamine-phosphate kinase [Endozoicomonadaceae bacterium StTr2]
MDEFSLIHRYFNRAELTSNTTGVNLGIGDDCAVVAVEPGRQLVQSIDTHVSGVHFPASAPPNLIAYRALAAALSDLAAMGGKPHSFYLALTLPRADQVWLEGFSAGLSELAVKAGVVLAGGDTTRGPLTISIMVQGTVPAGGALVRSGARIGDDIYVSGTLGDAAAGLKYALAGQLPDSVDDAREAWLLERFYKPSARLQLGQWLQQNGATSAIDISDGLLADLGHILESSEAGASLDLEQIPRSAAFQAVIEPELHNHLSLSGGEDFELCFTLPSGLDLQFPDFCQVTKVGRIIQAEGIFDQATGEPVQSRGYRHF